MPPAKSPPTRTRRLVTALLYAGCAGAAVFMFRPLVSAEPTPTPEAVPMTTRPVTDIDPLLLPPGHWTVLSAERLDAIAGRVRGEAVPPAAAVGCPLLPPGYEPLSERLDSTGRVTAFLSAAADWTAFEQHWRSTGWTLADASSSTGRMLTLTRGTERGVAWGFAAREPGRVHLLVTLSNRPK